MTVAWKCLRVLLTDCTLMRWKSSKMVEGLYQDDHVLLFKFKTVKTSINWYRLYFSLRSSWWLNLSGSVADVCVLADLCGTSNKVCYSQKGVSDLRYTRIPRTWIKKIRARTWVKMLEFAAAIGSHSSLHNIPHMIRWRPRICVSKNANSLVRRLKSVSNSPGNDWAQRSAFSSRKCITACFWRSSGWRWVTRSVF